MIEVATIMQYLTDRVSEAIEGVTVYSSKTSELNTFLSGTGLKPPCVFVAFDGFTNELNYEAGPAIRKSRWSIVFHGRGTDAEQRMLALMQAIHAKRQFTLTTDVETEADRPYNARVTGGSRIVHDMGFDSYALDVEVN